MLICTNLYPSPIFLCHPVPTQFVSVYWPQPQICTVSPLVLMLVSVSGPLLVPLSTWESCGGEHRHVSCSYHSSASPLCSRSPTKSRTKCNGTKREGHLDSPATNYDSKKRVAFATKTWQEQGSDFLFLLSPDVLSACVGAHGWVVGLQCLHL